MTYQVLARKWRPQDFSSLVGQDQIVTALRNALKEDRIAQAYLFSGIRGVGKTTAARVLAKALSCERRSGGDPCNACPSCEEINAGSTMDVIEVDAATYSKVEQVRELTETLRYGPANSRYKVVVLDEVHRLSKQAFDALLKIVEEPPAHLVFIFATTEIDAVPATILSRCQEFQFRRVPSPVLAEHLRTICKAEEIEVSDMALRLIARAGEGSVRDSVALLDQMATFGSGTITDEDAKRLLGGLDSAVFQKLIAAILAGDHGPILEVVREIESRGWDPHNVYSQFLGFSRDALHLALGASGESVDLPEEESTALKETLRPFGYEALLQVLQMLISSEGMVRRSEMGLLALEIAWLRAAELPKVQKLQDFLSGRAPLPPTGDPGPPRSSSGGGAAEARGSVEARSAGPPARSIRREESASTPPSPPSAAPLSEDRNLPPAAGPGPMELDRLPELFELLRSRGQRWANRLRKLEISIQNEVLTLHPLPGDNLLQKTFERQANRESLDRAVVDVWGKGSSWAIGSPASPEKSSPSSAENIQALDVETPRTRPTPSPRSTQTGRSSQPRSGGSSVSREDLADLPTVRTAMEMFSGKIRNIGPRSAPTEEASP